MSDFAFSEKLSELLEKYTQTDTEFSKLLIEDFMMGMSTVSLILLIEHFKEHAKTDEEKKGWDSFFSNYVTEWEQVKYEQFKTNKEDYKKNLRKKMSEFPISFIPEEILEEVATKFSESERIGIKETADKFRKSFEDIQKSILKISE